MAAEPDGPSAETSGRPSAARGGEPAPLAATPSPADEAPIPSGAEAQVGRAKEDVARRAGVPVAQVVARSVKSVEWRDSSLGCPQPGMMYAQVVTPGYLIVLEADGKTYEYHADRAQRVVTCDSPQPPLRVGPTT